jgi:feruloyl esterase
MVCKAGTSTDDCITKAQADALAANIRPVVDPVTKALIFPGMTRASEFDYLRSQYGEGANKFAVSHYGLAANDPKWDPATFDLHKDAARLDKVMGAMNTIDPDLRPFQARGGRMMEFHGWNDDAFKPEWTTEYYNRVVAKVGKGSAAEVQKFYRLFMLPGVGHCGGGAGPNNFGQETQTAVSDDPEHDAVSALMAWVEHGTAPQKLIATGYKGGDSKQGVSMQRPLYPYPAEAVWNGKGDTNVAASFRPVVRAAKAK